MADVHLRAVRADDLARLADPGTDDNPFNFYGYSATNFWQRRFGTDGLISEGFGVLLVEEGSPDPTSDFAGYVSWSSVQHGPTAAARALNIGIHLYPQFRGRGLGSVAQDVFARYLFDTTLYERLEAGTDLENVAEQRALTKAGFTREGVIRHGQYRAGAWHDLVLFSRLRGDVPG